MSKKRSDISYINTILGIIQANPRTFALQFVESDLDNAEVELLELQSAKIELAAIRAKLEAAEVWTECSKALPNEAEFVMCFMPEFDSDGSVASYLIAEAYLFAGSWFLRGGIAANQFPATHWKPLPTPPVMAGSARMQE